MDSSRCIQFQSYLHICERLGPQSHNILMTVPIIIDTHPHPLDDTYMNIRYFVLAFTLMVVEANADNSTLDAAIGGGIGGAAGAAIGNEIGGRDGAIIGGAIGGAVGAAVNTDEKPQHNSSHRKVHYRSDHYQHEHHGRKHHGHKHSGSYFCPPGQGKKGRC